MNKEPRYKSEIEVSTLEGETEPSLGIVIYYNRYRTEDNVEKDLDYYQWRFSQKAGKEVPRDEIKVAPAGTIQDVETHFRKKLGEPVYSGLDWVYWEAPYVLPKLVEDLEQYETEHDLEDIETTLIRETIDGLNEIINSKKKPVMGEYYILPLKA